MAYNTLKEHYLKLPDDFCFEKRWTKIRFFYTDKNGKEQVGYDMMDKIGNEILQRSVKVKKKSMKFSVYKLIKYFCYLFISSFLINWYLEIFNLKQIIWNIIK